MNNTTLFSDNLIEAINNNAFYDTKGLYTNSILLIPVFKVYQILDSFYPREDGKSWQVLGYYAEKQ